MRATKAVTGLGLKKLWNTKPPPSPRPPLSSSLFAAASPLSPLSSLASSLSSPLSPLSSLASSATTTTTAAAAATTTFATITPRSPSYSPIIRIDSNVPLSRSVHSAVVNNTDDEEDPPSPDVPAETPTDSVSPEVQRIHQELIETMNKHRIPPSALVFTLLQQCSSRADIKLALEAIERLRTVRAVQGGQQANFSPKLSNMVLDTCLRVDDPKIALKTIWVHNIYGFTPSLEAAHQILVYARAKKDIALMQNTLKTMVSNSLAPTRTTADIVIRTCKDQGNENLLFSLAKEFHEKGLTFRPALYDVCISSAANAGDVKHVMEIQQWRSKLKLAPTIASTFALSKAHLLKGRAKEAAELICSQVQDSEERDMYLRVLVRAWPVEVLSRRKRSVKEENLKTGIGAFFDELKSLGCSVGIDVAQEFGSGKETVRKVVYG
ncbi:unnamed protein product [Calypogeia fissa]